MRLKPPSTWRGLSKQYGPWPLWISSWILWHVKTGRCGHHHWNHLRHLLGRPRRCHPQYHCCLGHRCHRRYRCWLRCVQEHGGLDKADMPVRFTPKQVIRCIAYLCSCLPWAPLKLPSSTLLSSCPSLGGFSSQKVDGGTRPCYFRLHPDCCLLS